MVNSGDSERLKIFLSRFEDKVTTVVRDVTENKLSGYYLLRNLTALQESDGSDFIALLREVHHIPASIAKMIARGAYREVFSGSSSVCPTFRDDDDFSMAIAKLKSPWIEHLMQNFTLLFSRIGVRDNDYKDVKKSLHIIGIGA